MKLNETLRIVRKKISNKAAIVAVALVLGVVGGSVAGVRYTSAYQGDCDDNAIVHCGRETVSQLQAAYNGSSNVRSIYATAPFNLSSQKMAGCVGVATTGLPQARMIANSKRPLLSSLINATAASLLILTPVPRQYASTPATCCTTTNQRNWRV